MFMLQTNQLKAALPCAAVKDIRFYLNSVCIQARGKSLYIVSTDGHALFAGRLGFVSDLISDTDVSELAGEILIPADAVKAAVKLAGKSPVVCLEYIDTPDGTPGRYSLGEVTFTAIDGKFPDWQRVTPQAPTGEPASFDLDLLTKCRDSLRAWKNLGNKTAFVPAVQHNGTGPGLVTAGDEDAYCVAMPFRAQYEPVKPFAPDYLDASRIPA